MSQNNGSQKSSKKALHLNMLEIYHFTIKKYLQMGDIFNPVFETLYHNPISYYSAEQTS
jgi:hypothetical protein